MVFLYQTFISDLTINSNKVAAVDYSNTGILTFTNVSFNIYDNHYGFKLANGKLDLIGVNINYQKLSYSLVSTPPPAVLFLGGGTSVASLNLTKSTIIANFGQFIAGSSDPRNTNVTKLPCIIRTNNPVQPVEGGVNAVIVNANYNNYTIVSNYPTVVYTIYATTIDIPSSYIGNVDASGFRQLIIASNEQYYPNVTTTLNPAASQITIAGIQSNSTIAAGNKYTANISVNGYQWNLSDIIDTSIKLCVANMVITGDGNTNTSILINSGSVVNTESSIQTSFNQLGSSSTASMLKTSLLGSPINTHSVGYTRSSKHASHSTTSGNRLKAGTSIAAAVIPASSKQEIVIDLTPSDTKSNPNSVQATHLIKTSETPTEDGPVEYRLGSYNNGNKFTYTFNNISNRVVTVIPNPSLPVPVTLSLAGTAVGSITIPKHGGTAIIYTNGGNPTPWFVQQLNN